MNKQNIMLKALDRLNHPGKPAKIKVKTLFEKILKREKEKKILNLIQIPK